MRIYIESTIPSFVVARPARDILQAARQQVTKDWWEQERKKHELFISETVVHEIGQGEREMAEARLALVANIPRMEMTNPVTELSNKFLASGILPSVAVADSLHIALATVHKMHILLSWNCRHIANASIQVRLRDLAEKQGLQLPLLCTPQEMFEDDEDQHQD